LVGKLPFGRLRNKWEDNIKIYLREVSFEDVKWNDYLRIAASFGLCKHSDEPSYSINSIKVRHFLVS
jgi:hypothetical protein